MKTNKTKRIKQVFSTAREVLHLWANQSQTHARTSGTGGGFHSDSGQFRARCFFEGTSCYSYGRHYELGRLVTYKGQTVAVINSRGYSTTTAKHVRDAWHAVAHLPRVKSKQGIVDVKDALIEMQGKLIDEIMGIFSRRKFYEGYNPLKVEADGYKPWLLEEVIDFNKTCKALGFDKHKIDVTAALVALIDEHVALQRQRANDPELATARQAKALKKNAQQIEAWKAGNGTLTSALRNISPQLIRVTNNEVQTSRGARVPLPDALKLLRAIENGTAKSGDTVGHFTLSRVENGIVTIGCHTFSLADAKAVLQAASPLRLVS